MAKKEQLTYIEAIEKKYESTFDKKTVFIYCVIPFLIIMGLGIIFAIWYGERIEGDQLGIIILTAIFAVPVFLVTLLSIFLRSLMFKKGKVFVFFGDDWPEAREYIQNAEKNGEVLIRRKYDERGVLKDPTTAKYEVMLVDKYLCIEKIIFPIEKILWLVPKVVVFNTRVQGKRITTYEYGLYVYGAVGYYPTTVVRTKSLEDAQQVALEFYQYIINYMGPYSDELDKMWNDDRAGFIELFEQKKKEYEDNHK